MLGYQLRFWHTAKFKVGDTVIAEPAELSPQASAQTGDTEHMQSTQADTSVLMGIYRHCS